MAHNHGTSKTPDAAFDSIMLEATQDMPRHRQLFSRMLHKKAVSSASRLLARTIARPNAILFGAICAFAFPLLTYLLAKNLGYSLSGFESVAAFAVGWSAGIIFDVVNLRRLKNRD